MDARILRPCLAGPGPQVLRVGRTQQPPELWAALVPDEQHRNKISREHFEIIEVGSETHLRNISGTGTLVNGRRIRETAVLNTNDIVTLPSGLNDDTCVVSFRFWPGPTPEPGQEEQLGLVSTMPSHEQGFMSKAPKEFRLCCIGVYATPEEEIQQLPHAVRVIEATGSLRVGRTSTPKFFEALIPTERIRGMVSREQFEVRIGQDGQPMLINTSGIGTFVDGVRVQQQKATLRDGSIIAVPVQNKEGEAAVTFAFQRPGPDGYEDDQYEARTQDATHRRQTAKFGAEPERPATMLMGEALRDMPTGCVAAGYPGAAPPLIVDDRCPGTIPANRDVVAAVPTVYRSGARPPLIVEDCGPATMPANRDVVAAHLEVPAQVRSSEEPFTLECISALGLSTADLGFKPKFIRVFGPTTRLSVGRDVQPKEVWEELVPSERFRNTISREQFVISIEPGNTYVLTNKAHTGTFVNDQIVHLRTQLQTHDVVGVGVSPNDASKSVLRFRFSIGAGQSSLASSTIPISPAAYGPLPQTVLGQSHAPPHATQPVFPFPEEQGQNQVTQPWLITRW